MSQSDDFDPALYDPSTEPEAGAVKPAESEAQPAKTDKPAGRQEEPPTDTDKPAGRLEEL